MKILIVDEDGLIPVMTYGGTQRVIWSLGKELVRMGHQVSFLVRKGSRCDFARIIERDKSKTIVQQIPSDVDVVHFNSSVPEGLTKPYVATVHWSDKANLDINSIFISAHHAKRFGSDIFIYNGLDWDEYGDVNLSNRREYFHFLGKAAWRVKNVKGAIDVVKSIPGAKLKVLGGYRFNFKMGWRFTFHPRIHFYGMVGGSQKNALLQGSKGLIFPVKWHEPFGLALIESLFFGTPVFGTPYGSLQELILPEVGFLTNSRKEMIDHIQNKTYSAKICHEYARDLFNSRIMAEKYLEKYHIVASGHTINKSMPKSIADTVKPIWLD